MPTRLTANINTKDLSSYSYHSKNPESSQSSYIYILQDNAIFLDFILSLYISYIYLIYSMCVQHVFFFYCSGTAAVLVCKMQTLIVPLH